MSELTFFRCSFRFWQSSKTLVFIADEKVSHNNGKGSLEDWKEVIDRQIVSSLGFARKLQLSAKKFWKVGGKEEGLVKCDRGSY